MLLEKEWTLETDLFDLFDADAIASESPESVGGSSASSSATEATSDREASSVWWDCIDVLLGLFNNGQAEDDEPTQAVVAAALSWLDHLRRLFPTRPPTCIIKEPAGGLVVERRFEFDGKEMINELSFLNDGSAEWTDFVDGKVVDMQAIEFRLPSRSK